MAFELPRSGNGGGPSYESRILVSLALGWGTLQCGRFLLPPHLPSITESLKFSDAGIGVVLTVFGIVYAVTQYPSGTYSDALTRATLILPAFILLILGFVTVGFSTSKTLFVAAIVVLGVGKGLYASPSRALLGDLFTSRRGRALGIYSAGTDVGGLIASGLAVTVITFAFWRIAFLPVVLVLSAVAVLYLFWNREDYMLVRVPLSPGETVARITKTTRQRETLIAFSFFYFFVGGLTNFLPTLLVRGGFSEAMAGGSFALLFAVGIITKPLAGEVSDRYPRMLIGIGGLVVAVIGMVLILLASSFVGIALGVVLTAAGYKTQFPISDTLVMDAAPDGDMGESLGAARAVFLTSNAVGPGVTGVVAEFTNFETAFWILTTSLLVSIGLLVKRHIGER